MEEKTEPDSKTFISKHPVVVVLLIFIVLIFILALAGASSNSSDNTAPRPQVSQQQSALQVCLSLAQQNYSDDWDSACKNAGEAANCKLNSIQAGVLDNRLEAAKNDCYHQFPQ